MKTKIAFSSLVVGILAVTCLHCAQAQSDNSEKKMLEMVKDFYTNYITYVDKGELSKLNALQKKYCTPKLIKKIPELGDKIDQDPFLKAQDSNIKFLSSLTVKKDKNGKGHCIVSYDDEKVVINLTVLFVDGNYKIDNVW